MNQRIKLLAEQASHQSPDGYPVTIPYSKNFAEKFAELIVQECCDVITPYTIKDGVMFDVSTNLHPIYVLKKHFEILGD